MISQTDITRAWICAASFDGRDPAEWRRDEFGNAIQYGSYGTSDVYGWEVERFKPVSKGTDQKSKLRAVHWKVSRSNDN